MDVELFVFFRWGYENAYGCYDYFFTRKNINNVQIFFLHQRIVCTNDVS